MEILITIKIYRSGNVIFRDHIDLKICNDNLELTKSIAYITLNYNLHELQLRYLNSVFTIDITGVNIGNLHFVDLFEIMQNCTSISYFYTSVIFIKFQLHFNKNTRQLCDVTNFNGDLKELNIDIISSDYILYRDNFYNLLSFINKDANILLSLIEKNITKLLIRSNCIINSATYDVVRNKLEVSSNLITNIKIYDTFEVNERNITCYKRICILKHGDINYKKNKKIKLNSILSKYLKYVNLKKQNGITDIIITFDNNDKYIDLYNIYQYCNKNEIRIKILPNTFYISNAVMINKIFAPYFIPLDQLHLFSKNTNILSKCNYILKHKKHKIFKNNIIKYIYLLYINGFSIELLFIILHYYFVCSVEK